MKLRCPHCGKVLEMSLEELAANHRVVVCPQCLGEFVATDVDVPAAPAPQPAAQPQGGPTPVAMNKTDYAYCPNCGQPLPAHRLNFCPFCGHTLNLNAQPQAQPQQPDAPAQPQAEPQSQATHSAPPRPRNQLAHTRRYYHPELKSVRLEEQPASPAVRRVCYVIIALLALLFVFIVYQGTR